MSIAILILMLLAVVGGGTMVAILGWIMSRMKQLDSRPGDRSELGIISQQMDALRDQLFAVEDEIVGTTESLSLAIGVEGGDLTAAEIDAIDGARPVGVGLGGS